MYRIKAEPTITEYDTIVGDGDCGYTLRDGAKQVLSFIDGKDLARLPETVAQLVGELEVNMGGTSGALYCIYLTALASALASESSVSAALNAALQQLMKYTRARLGDRTMMDALIPFIDTLERTGDAKQAIEKAREGVEGTKKMEAKLGTYSDGCNPRMRFSRALRKWYATMSGIKLVVSYRGPLESVSILYVSDTC